MKRSSAVVSTTWRFVDPTSVTTQSGPAARSAAATCSGRAPTGPHAKQAPAPSRAPSTESAAESIAPADCARSRESGLRLKPTTFAPSTYSRAARPTEPPISPTPRTAMRMPAAYELRSGWLELLPGKRRGLLDRAQEVGESLGHERLRPVADRSLRLGVDLDDQPICTGRRGRQRERRHQVALSGGVARVHDHRKVGQLPEDGHGHEVEQEAVARLEASDAPLAEDHV